MFCCPGAANAVQTCQQCAIFRHLPNFDSFEERQLLSELLCICNCDTFLTVAVLWKTGADIVQWLMKNLSIEDPGGPADRC